MVIICAAMILVMILMNLKMYCFDPTQTATIKVTSRKPGALDLEADAGSGAMGARGTADADAELGWRITSSGTISIR